jgi:hypothetical protein
MFQDGTTERNQNLTTELSINKEKDPRKLENLGSYLLGVLYGLEYVTVLGMTRKFE